MSKSLRAVVIYGATSVWFAFIAGALQFAPSLIWTGIFYALAMLCLIYGKRIDSLAA